jgi:uncharacterized protein YegL
MKATPPSLGAVLLAPLALALLAPTAARANLDVVFVLDTTGSMSGEIREAKERVRQIASALRSERAQERVRLGVVAFRDRGDAYVTRISPLTEDVDISFDFLASLTADGGGDGPEDVLSGLASALNDVEWDLSESTERQAFLIGDAPPHLDYKGHVTPDAIIEAARAKRVVINGIGCRSLGGGGRRFFQRVAYATEGDYQHIGRVRVPGEDGGLAEAMLKSLARASDGPEVGDAVAQRVVARTAPAGETLYARLRRDGERCQVEVNVPDGMSLASGAPVVRSSADGLVVPLAPVPGDGVAFTLALERCPAPGSAVHVTLGESR